MAIIVERCKYCNAIAEERERSLVPSAILIKLRCGHTISVPRTHESELESVRSTDGKSLFDFQVSSVRFAENANLRCLLNLDLGLGKTVIDCAILKTHPEIQPVLIVCKASLIYQWFHEVYRWSGIIAQTLESGKDAPVTGFQAYICSYDLLGKMDFSEIGIKSVFIDECQAIKNPDAKRSKTLVNFCKDKDHIIATSNSPIKNNAVEYFTILNILRPHEFYNRTAFIRDFVDYFDDGYRLRFGGLQARRAAEFKERVSKFIIRYTRDEVMPSLPKIFRKFSFCDLGEEIQGAYDKAAEKFAEDYDGNMSVGSASIAYLSRMRHLCGLAKVDPAVDFITDHMMYTDRKLTVFVHHKDVGMILARKTDFAKPLELTADLELSRRHDIIEKFRTDADSRLLIASTLSSGEGLNLQFCSDAVMLERQWNPANEEQAEGRFPRPGSTASQINITYFVALSSIDEYLSEIVEKKRQYVNSTINGEASPWSESSMMKELAEKLVAMQRKKWVSGK